MVPIEGCCGVILGIYYEGIGGNLRACRSAQCICQQSGTPAHAVEGLRDSQPAHANHRH